MFLDACRLMTLTDSNADPARQMLVARKHRAQGLRFEGDVTDQDGAVSWA
jgi:hypothetical protein